MRRDMAKFHPHDDWKYQRFQLPTPENSQSYFRELPSGSKECFVDGTNWNQATNKSTICVCQDNYFGPDCGIPEAIWYGHFKNNPGDVAKLKRRPRMRRLIQAVLLNHEFDLFETRVHSLNNVTDVFLVQESKFTTHGDAKELKVLKKLHNGWLKDFHKKFLYVYLATFAEKQKISGWSADSYIREHIGVEGMKLVENTREDDLFLLLDADEVPLIEPLLFLKLYDGYGEPIQWNFQWNIYRFYWII